MMFEAYPDILTTKDLQRIFPKNRNAIYDLLKSGELPSFKLGREYMILKSDFCRESAVSSSLFTQALAWTAGSTTGKTPSALLSTRR